jgi:hypothetical protein
MDRKNIRAMVNLTGGYDKGLAEPSKSVSMAQFVGKRAVENAAPRKSPKAGLSHCAWKSRNRSGISAFSTAPATTG